MKFGRYQMMTRSQGLGPWKAAASSVTLSGTGWGMIFAKTEVRKRNEMTISTEEKDTDIDR
jgi:hypothetical protein